jgi:hypothetical protein
VNLKPRPRPPRIDWFRIMVNLDREGYSERDIAALIGMSKGWVEHLKKAPGAEPRLDDGMALLDLWCEAMDKTLVDVPRLREGVYG